MAASNGKVRYFVMLSIFWVCQSKCYSFDIRCPKQSEWNLRAIAKCGRQMDYFCLLDDNSNSYSEFCKRNPDITRDITWKEGHKCVKRGNLDGKKCTTERYQPFQFRTDGYSDCVYTKSLCQDEGLIIYKNGSTTVDTLCRCDHTKGFAFLSKPNRSCFCIPSHEDCTCYKKECKMNFKLTPNYMCTSIDSPEGQLSCSGFDTRSLMSGGSQMPKFPKKNTAISLVRPVNFKNESNLYTVRLIGTLMVVTSIMASIGCICCLLLLVFGSPFMEYQNYFSTIGNEVYMRCIPNPSYLMIRHVCWHGPRGEKISISNKYNYSQEEPYLLTIRNTDTKDSGSYACIVHSCLGYISIYTNLIVKDQLDISSAEPTCVLNSIKELLIQFDISNTSDHTQFLVKTVKWMKPKPKEEEEEEGEHDQLDLSQIEGEKKYEIIRNPPSLRIFRADDKDCSKYTCYISNGVKEIILSVEIDRPEILEDEVSYLASIGKTVKLICRVSSKIQIQHVTWYLNDNMIVLTNKENSNSRYIGGRVDDPSLTITNITKDDEGLYSCCVSNTIGTSTSTTIKLTVEDILKPDKDITTSPLYMGPTHDKSYRLGKEQTQNFAQVVLDKFEPMVAKEKTKNFLAQELRVVVVGKTGAGKSATCNMICGEKIFESSFGMAGVTLKTQFHRTNVYSQKVLLIDTPGVFDMSSENDDTEREIKKCIGIGAPGLHAILFVIGLGRFTKEDNETIETFLKYFGKREVEEHVIIVFTHGDELGNNDLDVHLNKAPSKLKEFIDRCSNRRVIFDNSLPFERRFVQVQCLISLIGKFRLEKEIKFYTDGLFEAAEKDMQKKENEIINQIRNQIEQLVKEKQDQFSNELASKDTALGTDAYKREKFNKELETLSSMWEDIFKNVREKARTNVAEEKSLP